MDFERSARTDLRFWALLVVGVVFAWAGSVVDPATNCDESGDCAPWLVPIAKWMGVVFTAAAAGTLWVNPRRGSRIDPVTGDLVWWQRRVGARFGGEGRIQPSEIGVIRIVSDSDSDAVHLYDRHGVLQSHFDVEVIPWPYERWAERLVERWPHIRLEKS